MVMSTKGNPFTRAERRVAFFAQNTFALFCQVLIKVVATDPTDVLLINILFVSPISILFNRTFYYLLACPCLVKYEKDDAHKSCCVRLLMFLGAVVIVPATLFALSLLIFCALFSGKHFHAAERTIGNYAWSVHVIAAIQELIFTTLLFFSGKQTSIVKVCGVEVFSVGKWYQGKVEQLLLKKDVDYYESEHKLCFFTFVAIVNKALYDKTMRALGSAKLVKVVPLNTTQGGNDAVGDHVVPFEVENSPRSEGATPV